MSTIRNIVNYPLLRVSYRDPKNIRNFLKNWNGLESLSLKGDAVALCILADLRAVTGIDPEAFNRGDRDSFNLGYLNGKLSHHQFMSLAYTLVLGYSQEELAWVMGVNQSVISRNINSGIKKIQKELKAFLEE